MRKVGPSGRIVAAILASLLSSTALAQDFDRVIPKLPPSPATPEVKAPTEPESAVADQRVLVPELKGLVFLSGMDAFKADGVGPDAAPDGVAVNGLSELSDPQLVSQLRTYIGRPLTQGDLDAIGRLVRTTYINRERPFVFVSTPPQNVSSGVVQLVVTEYRVGAIEVTGNRYFSSDRVRTFGDLKSGETLTLPRLRKSLDDYNQNPFLTVSAVMKPGQDTGLTDVELQAQDRLPVRGYAGYDNQGSPTLDRDEWYVGFNWGNVFGTGEIFSYQFTRAFNGRYESHSASYVVPVDPDNRVLIFGAYATQKPFLAQIFRSRGHSGQVSTRWAADLPPMGNFKHGLQVGFDFKRTDNNLEFAGFRILDDAVSIFQFPVVYTATMPDSYGETAVENLLVVSPGNIVNHNDDASLRRLVPGSDATYVYNRTSLTRTTRLPEDMSWIVRGLAQLASVNLPYSEQVGGGGIGSVRGYDSNTALGSNGILLSTELRSATFSPLQELGIANAPRDQLQLGLFVDYAYLRQDKRLPDLPRSNELASLGVNLRYNIDRYFDLQVEVGTQLLDPPGRANRKTQAAVVATLSF